MSKRKSNKPAAPAKRKEPKVHYIVGAIRHDEDFELQLCEVDESGEPTGGLVEIAEQTVNGTLAVDGRGRVCYFPADESHGSGGDEDEGSGKTK